MLKKIQALQSPSDVAQAWLLIGRRLSIEGVDLLPQENMYFPKTPLIVVRGQAQAFYLEDGAGRVWILKKFLPGRTPDAQYIKAIGALIPRRAGFESGHRRRVLSRASVAGASLPSPDFVPWVENTILMPQVRGSDWAYVADRVRDGTISLTPEQRLLMCRNLSEQVKALEADGLSHRDLSSTNVFIDTNTWDVHLIDWDSIYHTSLTIPSNTTFGTNGYIAPFVKDNGVQDAQRTWGPGADRFSLSVLNVEFLSMERDSPLTGDGGLLDQDEIFARQGLGLERSAGILRRRSPIALALFERTLRANDFHECPTPDEWITLGAGVTAPSLRDVYDPQPDFKKFIHALQSSPPPRPAPDLRDVEQPDLSAQYVPTAGDEGPPAPSLSEVEAFDPRALSYIGPGATAPTAPDL
ncbi:MAG: RIO1 family regulatory kinase/ATPase, partial [Pyrinomonadaceae bacterium]